MLRAVSAESWRAVVAYSKLIGLRGPGVAESRGFTRECFPIFEEQKREREVEAQQSGIMFAKGRTSSQLSEPVWPANDARWNVPKPWGFVPYRLKFGGRCVYCGDHIPAGTLALYSRKIQSVAHVECRAGQD